MKRTSERGERGRERQGTKYGERHKDRREVQGEVAGDRHTDWDLETDTQRTSQAGQRTRNS